MSGEVQKKKKVLVLVDWFWPGFRAGGPIRSTWHLVRWLKDEFEFSVITSDTDHLADHPYSAVESDAWNTAPGGIRVYYASMPSFSKQKLKELVEAESPDVILMNSMFSKPFTIWPLQLFSRGQKKIRLLLAPRGMLAAGSLGVKSFKKKLYLRWFRMMKFHRSVDFLATVDHEKQDILAAFGNDLRVLTAPNLPSPELPVPVFKEKKSGEAVFISLARFSPEKNNLWLLRLFQKIRGNATLLLYGPHSDDDYWRQCRAVMEDMPSGVRVDYRGFVEAEKIDSALSEAHFFILPTLGENFGHSIFEALACGKPVLISDKTPWRNLEALRAGWDVPLQPETEMLLRAEACIAMGPEEYRQWSGGSLAHAHLVHRNSESLLLNRKALMGG